MFSLIGDVFLEGDNARLRFCGAAFSALPWIEIGYLGFGFASPQAIIGRLFQSHAISAQLFEDRGCDLIDPEVQNKLALMGRWPTRGCAPQF